MAMARIPTTSSLCFLLLLATSYILSIESAPQSALVSELPGFTGTFPSKHYAGYVSIEGKNLFYYFVESERNPSKDPVVLWLNGGPGCSSFDAFVYEHGPFNFEAPKKKGDLPKLHLNPHSWSKVSNIIYLDSPCGVGFSYSSNVSNYETGDLQTSSDTHSFLLKWFDIYKEFQPNPFYISGESYAGIYVPTLASEVVKGLDAAVKPVLNFKGYMVGNGVTDPVFDGNALVSFAYGMGLISDQLHEEVVKECAGNYYDPRTEACKEKLDKVYQDVDGLNIYDILEPCYHGSASGSVMFESNKIKLPSSFRNLGETDSPHPVRKRMFGRAWPYRAPVRDGIVPTWGQLSNGGSVPCINDAVANTWLNRAEVRKAMHAEEESVAGKWDLCTDRVTFTHDSGSMISYHRNLTARGFRAVIYSGDHDMCVPFTGSEAWTRSLGYKTIDDWRPWMTNDQVAGFVQVYDNNLTFLTVKGSGHTVPEYKPREALHFYSRWLAGESI